MKCLAIMAYLGPAIARTQAGTGKHRFPFVNPQKLWITL